MMTLLKMLLAAARVSAAKQAAARLLARMAMAVALLLAAIGLLLAGCGFGLYALYLLLNSYMAPAPAAVVIAAGLTMTAAAIIAIVVFGSRRGKGRRAATTGFETVESLAELLGKWVKANPGQATATAFVVGFLAGSKR